MCSSPTSEGRLMNLQGVLSARTKNISMNACRPSRCVLIATTLCMAGCATLPNGRSWGDDATIVPGWERVRASAINAASDPWVWAPLAGGAVTQVDHFDRKISNWARRDTPVFGSQAQATTWSNELRSASVAADAVTVLLTPSGEWGASWVLDKLKGYAVDLAAATTAIETTTLLKDATQRTRPNDSGTDSFPSGHAATSAVYTRLATVNLDQIDMSDGARGALDTGLQVLNFGTAWARIEGGWHYPSDTLMSIALGNFCGMFFNDAFLGLDTSRAKVAFAPRPGGGELRWQFRFAP
jgi:membrane-associated phospholipid phosphatase